jgi:hypothetical protein
LLSTAAFGSARDSSAQWSDFTPATRDLVALKSLKLRNPWPLQSFEIGAGFSDVHHRRPMTYFHGGLDLIAPAGAPIRSVSSGRVLKVRNCGKRDVHSPYCEVTIVDDHGLQWIYAHIDPRSVPGSIAGAFKTGTRIEAGTALGNVMAWPNKAVYDHLHLGVFSTIDGYLNPMLFLEPLEDRIAPRIFEIGLAREVGNEIVDAPSVTGGLVRRPVLQPAPNPVSSTVLYIPYVKTGDLVRSPEPGKPANYLGPHSIWFELDGVKRGVWAFDRLPIRTYQGERNSSAMEFHNRPEVFELSLMPEARWKGRARLGMYGPEPYYISLAFGQWNELRPVLSQKGRHRLVVHVMDFAGNVTSKDFDWEVR